MCSGREADERRATRRADRHAEAAENRAARGTARRGAPGRRGGRAARTPRAGRGRAADRAAAARQRAVAAACDPRPTHRRPAAFRPRLRLAVQVASTSDTDSALRGARQEDLVRILDELDDRTSVSEDEKQGLEKQREELENSSDQAEEARRQTIEKERQLGVLAGTVAAQGPGIEMTIEDTKGTRQPDQHPGALADELPGQRAIAVQRGAARRRGVELVRDLGAARHLLSKLPGRLLDEGGK